MVPARPASLTLIFAILLLRSLAAQSAPASTAQAAQSAQEPAWQSAIEARRKQLVDQNGPGTDAPLRAQLLQMLALDQRARGFSVAPAQPGRGQTAPAKELLQSLPATDAQLTLELKQIVEQKGWPTISLVGLDASNAALLVLTHTADHAWQLQLLPQLEQMADANKIDASSLAIVIDKELVSEGKLQRYGTQFKVVNGGMAMFGVEEPATLDQRRAKALLPPLDVYKMTLEAMYHLKATNAIVSATPVKPPQN